MRGSILGLPSLRLLGRGWSLRLLPAKEALTVRREGEELAGEDREKALCVNACLVAHVLKRWGKPAFQDGAEVLKRLTAGQIGFVAQKWGEFDRECDPAPWEEKAVEEAKKGWSTRLMNAFSGVCSRNFMPFPPKSE